MYLTKSPVVTCPFLYVSKKKPSPWAAGYHPGVDFKAFLLTPIYAPAKSKIIHSGRGGWGGAYGNHVIGESVGTDGRKYRWIAAHLTTAAAKVGATIEAGARIGLSGNTGNTFGPHLHFEVRQAPFRYEDHVNPAVILNVKVAPVKPPKPPRPIHPWFNAASLNTAGNNSVLAATISKRADTFLDDVTAGNPAVIGFCELRSDQVDEITREMGERGYKRAAYSNMLAVFVRAHVIVRGSSFAKYKHQGKGSKEGMLRVKLTIDGSKCQVGVTHLDYPGKSTSLRVAQMKEGIASLRRYGLATLLPDWRSRSVILTDTNDKTGAVLKAAKAAGFKDAGAGASIDHILVGTKRVMRGASKSKTSSDHPIVRARLGRY